jgi:uncharacterized protein
VLRKRSFGVSPETRLSVAAYEPAVTERVYRLLSEAAAEALETGYAVAADAVFLRPDERDRIGKIAAEKGVRFTGLWLEAPPEMLARRIHGRENDASDADVEVMRRQAGLDPGPMAWRRVDARGELADTIARAHAILSADAT